MIGEADVEVQYKGQSLKLRLIVVKGDGPSLMGQRVDTADGDRLEDTVSGFKLGQSTKCPVMYHDKVTCFAMN